MKELGRTGSSPAEQGVMIDTDNYAAVKKRF